MAYESLSHLYRRDEHQWRAEHERRRTSPMTRNLNFILQEYGRTQTYPAFYCYTEELALLQEAIGRDFTALLGHIAHVPTAGIDQFLHTCLVQEILATNAFMRRLTIRLRCSRNGCSGIGNTTIS